MAKAKLQQIELTSGDSAAQPPLPGGWVLAVFDALNSFSPAFGAKFKLPIGQRTGERINAAETVKQRTYDRIEGGLVELITALFPKTSTTNGFAKKYVDDYFRLWQQSIEFAPTWAKCLGFNPRESHVLGRALTRDLVLRLCYLESCERRFRKIEFTEGELACLRHDSPVQLYQALISARTQSPKDSVEKLARQLEITPAKTLHRIKRGQNIPLFSHLLKLKPPDTGGRLLAGIGFFDWLLKTLRLDKSGLRNEFLTVASVFFRNHPPALEAFRGTIPPTRESGSTEFEACGFERFAGYVDGLLLHPGFQPLMPEMPDALWRCHLLTLQLARMVDLAQAYYQFSEDDSDSPLEDFLRDAEHESGGNYYRWMHNLQLHKRDLRLPPANEP